MKQLLRNFNFVFLFDFLKYINNSKRIIVFYGLREKLLIITFLSSITFLSNSNLFGQCSGSLTLTNITDTLSDGSGYGKYTNDLNCEWIIQPTGANFIYLQFNELNTESSP